LTLIFFLSQASYVLAQEKEPKVLRMNAVSTLDNESNPCFFTYKDKKGILFTSNRKSDALSSHVDIDGYNISDLYFAEISESGTLKKAKNIDELNTKKHEAASCLNSDGSVIYISKNIKAKKNISAPDRFGIFYSTLEDGYWSVPTEFEHNSKDDKGYSIVGPAISPDGKTLVFYSDMDDPDNKDFFMSKLDLYGNWSKPTNLGPTINTSGAERYPSFDAEGNLYFSSTGYSKNRGWDILRAKLKNDGTWDTPELLPEPINSKYDDFGIATIDGENGYLSSNRNKKTGDDLYSFFLPKDKTPEFTDCKPNKKRHLCYYVYDDNINMENGDPYRFDWLFDDGTKLSGQKVKKCFPKPDTYLFTLNITDTLANEVFKKVSEGSIVVEDIQTPFIISKDIYKKHQTIKLSAVQQELVPFKITEYYWLVDGKKVELGEKVSFVFDEPGTYRITLGVIGDPDNPKEKRCVYKEIEVK